MAEETPKPQDPTPEASPQTPLPGVTDATNVTDGPLLDKAPALTGGPQPEPLADGTVPTVLQKGDGSIDAKKEVKGGNGAVSSVYRRADIITTLLTLVGALVIAGVIIGGYYFFTKSKAKPVVAPKVTTLDKTQLDKVGSFFGGNSAGANAEVLTVSSSTLFTGRVAVGSDLKVTGGLQVGGTSSLSDVIVEKTATLAATNIRGQLTVTGPTNLQSPALFSAGASVNGNITVSGNGSFGGSLSAGVLNVRDISVTGTLNLAGHLAITGQNPSASPDSGAGASASANVDGNDSAGTVTVNTGSIPNSATGNSVQLVKVTFRTPYAKVPRVIITPTTISAAALTYYVLKTNAYFIIGTTSNATSGTGYSFDYWVVQ